MAILLVSEEFPFESEAYITRDAAPLQIDSIEAQVHEIDSLILFTKAQIQEADSTLFNGQDHKMLREWSNWKLELKKKKFELTLSYIHSGEVVKDYEWRVDRNKLYYLMLGFFCAAFGGFTAGSFIDWRNYLQIYQDVILMRQAGVDEEKIDQHLKKIEGKREKREKGFLKRLFSRKKKEGTENTES